MQCMCAARAEARELYGIDERNRQTYYDRIYKRNIDGIEPDGGDY